MTRTTYTAPWTRVVRLETEEIVAGSPTLVVKSEEIDSADDVWTQQQDKSLWDYWKD